MPMSSHSLTRSIIQRGNRADAAQPLKVIAVEGTVRPDDKLGDVAPHLYIVEAHDHDDLSGVNVVHILPGQTKHPLFENAESRRRSRMLG